MAVFFFSSQQRTFRVDLIKCWKTSVSLGKFLETAQCVSYELFGNYYCPTKYYRCGREYFSMVFY